MLLHNQLKLLIENCEQSVKDLKEYGDELSKEKGSNYQGVLFIGWNFVRIESYHRESIAKEINKPLTFDNMFKKINFLKELLEKIDIQQLHFYERETKLREKLDSLLTDFFTKLADFNMREARNKQRHTLIYQDIDHYLKEKHQAQNVKELNKVFSKAFNNVFHYNRQNYDEILDDAIHTAKTINNKMYELQEVIRVQKEQYNNFSNRINLEKEKILENITSLIILRRWCVNESFINMGLKDHIKEEFKKSPFSPKN